MALMSRAAAAAAFGAMLLGGALTGPLALAQAPAPTAAPDAAAGAAGDTVVAKVEGETIRRSDVTAAFDVLPPELRQLGLDSVYPMLLERMIQRRLLTQKGREKNLGESAEVQERLKEYEDQLVARAYLDTLIEERMTEDTLREQYERYLEANPPREEIRASHILLNEESAARKVISEVEAGKDFAAAARESSVGPSAPKGGDLGYFGKEDMVQPFAEVAFAMQPGEVSKEPVKTQFGWHVIKVVDRRQSEAASFEEVRPQLVDAAEKEMAAQVIEGLTEEAAVERFTLGGEPMPAGGTDAPGAQ